MTKSAVSILVAVGVAFAVMSGSTAIAQNIQINQQNKTIAISATDEATAVADVAAITIGFHIFKPDADTASAEGGRLSQAIMKAIHDAGVNDKNIESKSQGVSRNPSFEYNDAAYIASRQFQFEQSWEVKVDPKNAPEVLRVALAAGANESGTIDWLLVDRPALQTKAAANALAKAHAMAGQMAQGLNVKLGALIYITNQGNSKADRFAGSMEFDRIGLAAKIFTPPPPPPLEIRPQTIREEATVYAVFAIE
jgi:uncharacterized protein